MVSAARAQRERVLGPDCVEIPFCVMTVESVDNTVFGLHNIACLLRLNVSPDFGILGHGPSFGLQRWKEKLLSN